jgi:hypothetical protein
LIHHFAVQYPFYMRLWISKEALPLMRANGVRFNDFEAVRRANRWYPAPVHGQLDAKAAATQAA